MRKSKELKDRDGMSVRAATCKFNKMKKENDERAREAGKDREEGGRERERTVNRISLFKTG